MDEFVATFRCAGSEVQVPAGTLTSHEPFPMAVCPGCREFALVDLVVGVERIREHPRTAVVVLA
jgi:hypothetical protein